MVFVSRHMLGRCRNVHYIMRQKGKQVLTCSMPQQLGERKLNWQGQSSFCCGCLLLTAAVCRYEARAVARNPSAFTKIAPLTYRPPRIAAAIAKECAEVLFEVCRGNACLSNA